MTAPLNLTVNGEPRTSAAATIAGLVGELGLKPEKVAVERNGTIVPRSTLGEAPLADGDVLEIVHFVGGGDHAAPAEPDTWTVAGRIFRSRLIVGTGKYKDFAQNAAALEESGAEIVTVAVRRVNISDPNQPVLMDYIDPKKVTYLPNTAGCFTADEAIRTLRLAREAATVQVSSAAASPEPPPTKWTISSTSPSANGASPSVERGTIVPLRSTATFSGLRPSSPTRPAIVAAALVRGSPLTVRLSGAVMRPADKD